MTNNAKKFMRGNDAHIKWHVKRGEASEDFTGKTVKVTLLDSEGNSKRVDWEISGGTILLNYWGKDQDCYGSHTLHLVENDGEYGMATIDFTDAFILVEHSYLSADSCSCPDLNVEVIELTSEIDLTGGASVNVIDDLESDLATDALSARQGKVLNRNKQEKQDVRLKTTSKEVVGAINEIFDTVGLAGNLLDIINGEEI